MSEWPYVTRETRLLSPSSPVRSAPLFRARRLIGASAVSDIYSPDKPLEATLVMGADDMAHPAVSYLHKQTKEFYLGGKVQAIQAPTHYDYVPLRCM